MTKAIIYARVSSREQEREGYSIPAQLKLLNEYAEKKGLRVIKEFTDNETAKKEGRTNFNEMLGFLKKNKDVRTILVEKTDRLYRNFKDYVLLDDLEGLEIHLIKEGTVLSENSRSHDKFIHGIKVLMAKNYIDNLSEEVKKGFQQKCELGEYPANPPLGYKRVDTKTIVIDTETSPLVSKAFNLYAEGNRSLTWVVNQLHKEGFIYKPNRPRLTKSHLESILKNIFYTGQFYFGGKYYRGLHEPLISEELFNKVQLAFKKDGKPLYRQGHSFAFASMIRCDECGSIITAEIKKGKYVYYHCTHGKGECNQDKYIREESLEEQFQKAVFAIHMTDEQKDWVIKALKESNKDEQEFHKEKIRKLNIECEKWRERINQIYLDKLDAKITEEFWREKHVAWTKELKGIQELIDAYDKANEGYLEFGVQFLNVANKAKDLYIKQCMEEKSNFLKMILSNCTLKEGILHWEYKRPFDIFANGLSFSKTLGRKDSNPRMAGPKPAALPLGDSPIKHKA